MDGEYYSDKDFHKYNVAVHKAVNKEECPVKQKHVRSAIIGTFNQQGAQIFWSVALRLPCMDDVIVAWKFCYVLHKILREGHPLCIDSSQRHRKHLNDIGKLWGHLEEGYGKLIQQYIVLLITKLDFHRRNPRFPGNLNVTTEDLKNICANNPDICFELSVEIFDYLDTILELQHNIFAYKSSSMTMQGQCRLAPIIPCIQDASRLYDHNVKIMFQLHSIVPYDDLSGHRDRFLKQFKKLKKFYQNTAMLHYFKNLITVSQLPDYPPNFKANFNTYVTQEVYVPQEEEVQEEPIQTNLIDTTDSVPNHVDSASTVATAAIIQEHLDIIAERDNIIKSLRDSCQLLRSEINDLYKKGQAERNRLQDEVSTLETNLAIKNSELMQEKEVNEANAVALIQNEENKAMKEEKFKNSYLKLREEHIVLLREKARVDKAVKLSDEKRLEIEKLNETLENTLKEVEVQHVENERMLKSSAMNKNEELEAMQESVASLKSEMVTLTRNLEDVCNDRAKAQEELQTWSHKNDELNTKLNDLISNIAEQDLEIKVLQNEKKLLIEDLIKKALQENEIILNNAIEEMENPAISAVSCSAEYLRSLHETCEDALKMALQVSRENTAGVITTGNRISHKIAIYILLCKATLNTSPDILIGEKMAETSKALGKSVLDLLNCMIENKPTLNCVEKSLQLLTNTLELAEKISGSVHGESAENLEITLESEIASMDKAIDEAAKKIEEMLSKSRELDSGIKLQVNERIIESCTALMQAIRVLVQKSKLLQAEIITQGKGSAGAKEFYKANHKWTDGFISAAKAIGIAANFLLNAADKAVSGEGKLELLVVAAHEISASTVQLVVASRVKSNRNSTNLQQLSSASKDVANAAGAIVGTVKDCSELIEESKEVDMNNMTLHQAKRLQMDTQVRVLELEKELQQERFKLAALRKYHYQLAGETEGWEIVNT